MKGGAPLTIPGPGVRPMSRPSSVRRDISLAPPLIAYRDLIRASRDPVRAGRDRIRAYRYRGCGEDPCSPWDDLGPDPQSFAVHSPAIFAAVEFRSSRFGVRSSYATIYDPTLMRHRAPTVDSDLGCETQRPRDCESLCGRSPAVRYARVRTSGAGGRSLQGG